MNPDDESLPEPEALELEAESMPVKVSLRRYRRALQTMRDKKYSYQEIAAWISKSLGTPISRNQVAYVLNADPALQELEEQEEHEEELRDEHEERSTS